jgi:hypothetical protein
MTCIVAAPCFDGAIFAYSEQQCKQKFAIGERSVRPGIKLRRGSAT